MTHTREQGGDSRLCSVAYLNVVDELYQEAVGLEEQKNQGECLPCRSCRGLCLSICPGECHLPMCPPCACPTTCVCEQHSLPWEGFGGHTSPEDKASG